MKNIIIGGAARSGKTILSQKISKEFGHSHIPTDAFVGAFEVFPQCGIAHDGMAFETICENFEPFLHGFFVNMDYIDIPYIIDSYHITPEIVVQNKWHEQYQVLFLGFPNINLEDKLNHIKQNKNRFDWTEDISEDELRSNIRSLIERSRYFEKECRKLGLQFYDTGTDFETAMTEIMTLLQESQSPCDG